MFLNESPILIGWLLQEDIWLEPSKVTSIEVLDQLMPGIALANLRVKRKRPRRRKKERRIKQIEKDEIG